MWFTLWQFTSDYKMYLVCRIPYWRFVPVGWLTRSSRRAGRWWPRLEVLMIACPKIHKRKCITTAEEQLKPVVLYWEIPADEIPAGFSALKFYLRKTRYKFAVHCHFDTMKNSTHFWFWVLVCLLLLNQITHKVISHVQTPTHISTQRSSRHDKGGLSQGTPPRTLCSSGDVHRSTQVEQMWGCWWRVCALYWVKRKLPTLKSGLFLFVPMLPCKNLVRKTMDVFCYQKS